MPYNAIYISFIYYIANDPEARFRSVNSALVMVQESSEGFNAGGILAPFSDVFTPSNSHQSVEWALILPIFSSSTSTKSVLFHNRSCHRYFDVQMPKATWVLWIYGKALIRVGTLIIPRVWNWYQLCYLHRIHMPMYNVRLSLSGSLWRYDNCRYRPYADKHPLEASVSGTTKNLNFNTTLWVSSH